MNQELLLKQKGIRGFETCPNWLKLKYRQAVDFCCQNCKRYEKDVGILIPHRLRRGWDNGLYTIYPLNHRLNNIRVLCKECHKKVHANEFSNIKSK